MTMDVSMADTLAEQMQTLERRLETMGECVTECSKQFMATTTAMNHITNILFDFVNDNPVSRSEIFPHIVQLVKEISGETLNQKTQGLQMKERNVFNSLAVRFSECEKLIYDNMKKVANLRHTNEHTQAVAIATLEKQLEQRDKEIKSLATTENVMLWQKEKSRILKDHDKIISELHQKIAELEKQKESLRLKYEEQTNDLKMEKMKVEITRKRSTAKMPADSSEIAMLEDLKRKQYLLEKDLQHGEKEIQQFQLDVIGLLGGIQIDIAGIAEASEHQPTVNSLGSLSDTIDKIKSAVAGQIDVGVMRADLSDHYLPAKPNDFFVTNKGRKVIVKPMQIRKNSKSQRKKSITVLSDLPSLQVGALSRHRRARKKSRPSIHTIEEAGKISKINPKLLDNIYGTLDTVAVMKHFPTLSTSYVKSQWANFKRYDSDDNGELDLSEIMKAITGLMPSHVKPAHIEAAMREVDIDGSGTMDFYEYLQVALLLEQKKGKSELFHTPEVTKYNKQISKTCIVQ